MLDFQAARWLMNGEVPKQAGNNHPTSIPTGVFKTRDGYMNLAVSGHKIWVRFCNAIGAPELATHPDYATGALRSQEPRPPARRHRGASAAARRRRVGRAAERGRRAVRADLLDRPGVRRSAGAPSRHRREARRRRLPRPAGDAEPHARAQSPRIRRRSASTPTPCCARSATTTPRSSASGARESFDEGSPDAQRQDDLPQGRRRRLDDLQQPGAPQRDLARDVGGGARDHGRLLAPILRCA